MGTRTRSILAVLVVLSLASHSLGFRLGNLVSNLAEVEKSVGKRDTGIRHSLEKTAADALLDYFLRMFDSSHNGESVLAEVRQIIKIYFDDKRIVADSILDDLIETFDSNNGRMTELKPRINRAFEERKDWIIKEIKDFLDTNNDCAISKEELTRLRGIRKSRFKYDTITEQDDRAGLNELDDQYAEEYFYEQVGGFTEEEARAFEKLVSTELSPDQLRRANQYLNRVDHLGQDV